MMGNPMPTACALPFRGQSPPIFGGKPVGRVGDVTNGEPNERLRREEWTSHVGRSILPLCCCRGGLADTPPERTYKRINDPLGLM